MQEALVAAWRSLDRFDDRSTLRTWRFGILAHKIASARRRRRAVPVDTEALDRPATSAHGDPVRHASDVERRTAIGAALADRAGGGRRARRARVGSRRRAPQGGGLTRGVTPTRITVSLDGPMHRRARAHHGDGPAVLAEAAAQVRTLVAATLVTSLGANALPPDGTPVDVVGDDVTS